MNSLVDLEVRSFAGIGTGSKIVVEVPTGIYSKIGQINSQNCSCQVGTTQFTGCQYNIDSQGWVTQVNISNLGTTDLPKNTTISLKLPLTNSWSSIPFNSQALTLKICSPDNNYLSQGTLLVSTLNNASNFQPVAITSLNVS